MTQHVREELKKIITDYLSRCGEYDEDDDLYGLDDLFGYRNYLFSLLTYTKKRYYQHQEIAYHYGEHKTSPLVGLFCDDPLLADKRAAFFERFDAWRDSQDTVSVEASVSLLWACLEPALFTADRPAMPRRSPSPRSIF